MAKEWKPAVGFEGYYEVSEHGNVRRVGKNKCLSLSTDRNGYQVTVFCCNSVRTNVMAHKLVFDAFVGTLLPGNVVRHVDGDPGHNHKNNLIQGTPKQNSEDMVQHGTQAKGEKQHLSKLTEADVLNIRQSTSSNATLAKQYGVSAANIHFIRKRITWKHI